MGRPIYIILRYVTVSGRQPYAEWLFHLKDSMGKDLIRAHVERLAVGYFGRSRFVGDGLWELKIDFGPGYRVYYLKDGINLIILFCAGTKRTQWRDISQAKKYVEDYR